MIFIDVCAVFMHFRGVVVHFASMVLRDSCRFAMCFSVFWTSASDILATFAVFSIFSAFLGFTFVIFGSNVRHAWCKHLVTTQGLQLYTMQSV